MDTDVRAEIEWAVQKCEEVAARLRGLLPGEEPGFPIYSQRDPRWADEQLGPDRGGGTIGG